MDKELIISKIVATELNFFKSTRSIGGPAPCQSQEETFILARSAYWSLYPKEVLDSYMEDLNNALNNNLNLVTIKYAYMMKNTSPDEFEKIKNKLPLISSKKQNLVKAIVLINMFWEEEVRRDYINLANENRPLYSKDDSLKRVSVETYFRGELLTYSEKTLEILAKFYVECFEKKLNLVYENFSLLSEKKNSLNNVHFEEKIKEKEIKVNSNTLLNTSSHDAQILKEFAFKKAKELNIDVTITVLDSTGNILLVSRMDNAIIASIEISKNKAFSAFSLNESTHILQNREDIKNINLQVLNGHSLCFLGGGIPIKYNCRLIGALAISGGKVEEDILIAEYALKNWLIHKHSNYESF